MPRPRKTRETVSAARVRQYVQSRFNPIRDLTPQVLSQRLERFDCGYLSDAALLFEQLEDRDDTLKSVAPKRKKSVSRHGWEIITFDATPAALRQKEICEHFFGSLTASSAVDGNLKGGMNLLVRQMMDSVGKKYAVHEIVWSPSAEGLSATFTFVPLWFFENTTGHLRYLETASAITGVELPPAEWMVTVGDGLMLACAVCYIFKHLPLKDWLIYSERHGMPYLHGKSNAAEGSPEWDTLVTALQNFGADASIVTNMAAEINAVDASASGELPYPKLVERMDRAMAALWRGADLSTMSAGGGEGTGASLQGEEADILEEDDAQLVSETLNRQVLPYVLKYALGASRALVEIRIGSGNRQDVTQDLQVDRFLIESGCAVSRNDLLERYGRPIPDAGEELATAPVAIPNEAAPPEPRRSAADRVTGRLVDSSTDLAAEAFAADLQPLAERLETILQIQDQDLRDAALRKYRADLPDILRRINADPAAAAVLQDAMAAGVINGFTAAALNRKGVAA